MGTANIAIRSVIPALISLNKKFNISYIASRSAIKADKYAKELNIMSCYSYQDLIEKEDLDAVYIPLPNSLHAEWVKKSLEKGLHVLVEKSLGCNFVEVKRLNKKSTGVHTSAEYGSRDASNSHKGRIQLIHNDRLSCWVICTRSYITLSLD